MKTLSKLQTIVLGTAFCLSGCRDPSHFKKSGVVDYKYLGVAELNADGRFITVYEGTNFSKNYVHSRDTDNNGRFDFISITVPKGSPLEEYARLEKLEEVYRKITE